jgi:HEAT repeat protein
MSDKQAYSIHATSGMDMDGLIKTIRYTNPGIRWRAALALGDIGDSRALDPIRDMLHDKDEYVRRASEDAIRKIERKNE